jgi:hypothetical protein
MMKTSLIVAGLLAVSGSAAMAQSGGNWMTNWIPPGPTDAPGGANGAAPGRYMGDSAVTTNGQGTTSSSMLEQQTKRESAMGQGPSATASTGYTTYQAQAQRADEPMGTRHRAYITDEYGFKYDRYGNRLDGRGNVISPHTR